MISKTQRIIFLLCNFQALCGQGPFEVGSEALNLGDLAEGWWNISGVWWALKSPMILSPLYVTFKLNVSRFILHVSILSQESGLIA